MANTWAHYTTNCAVTAQNGKVYITFKTEPSALTKDGLRQYGFLRLNKVGNQYVARDGMNARFFTKLLAGKQATEEFLYGKEYLKGGVA